LKLSTWRSVLLSSACASSTTLMGGRKKKCSQQILQEMDYDIRYYYLGNTKNCSKGPYLTAYWFNTFSKLCLNGIIGSCCQIMIFPTYLCYITDQPCASFQSTYGPLHQRMHSP
jgi:hypothetical protein